MLGARAHPPRPGCVRAPPAAPDRDPRGARILDWLGHLHCRQHGYLYHRLARFGIASRTPFLPSWPSSDTRRGMSAPRSCPTCTGITSAGCHPRHRQEARQPHSGQARRGQPHRGRRPDPATRPDPLAGGCSSFPWHPCPVAGGEDSTCHVQFRVTPGVPHHQVIRSPMAYSARPDAIATGPRGKNDDDHRNRRSSDRGLCRRDGNRLPLPRLGRSDDRRRRRAAVGAGLPSAGTRSGTFSHRPRAGPARARRERPSGR